MSLTALQKGASSELSTCADHLQGVLDRWPETDQLEVPRAALDEAIAILRDAHYDFGAVKGL